MWISNNQDLDTLKGTSELWLNQLLTIYKGVHINYFNLCKHVFAGRNMKHDRLCQKYATNVLKHNFFNQSNFYKLFLVGLVLGNYDFV